MVAIKIYEILETQRGHEEAAIIHKISIQIGSVISEAFLQLNRHFTSDRRRVWAIRKR